MPSDKPPAFRPGDTLSTTAGLQVTVQSHMDTLAALFADPAVSGWFKQAIPLPDRRMGATHAAERGDLARRDPLDALHDVELLQALVQDRLEACLYAKAAPEPQEGCPR